MQTLTILVDTREQVPLEFPSTLRIRGRRYLVKVKKQALPAGDYMLEGCDASIVERKGSIRELFTNFVTDDKKRMKKALDKLCKATSHPVLFVEGGIGDLSVSRDVPDCGAVLQILMDECARRGIQLFFAGKCRYKKRRQQAGEAVLRLLAAYMRNS